MDAVMIEQIVVGISRVALKLMERLLSNDDQASRHGASVVENNSEVKKAELSYYKKKLELDNQSLQLQRKQRQFALELALHQFKCKLVQQETDNEIPRERIGLENLSLELKEIKIAIQKEQRNLSYLRQELLREQQEKEIELKLQEIQAEWDKDTWLSQLSRFETEQILKKYQQTLLILACLPSVASDRSLAAMRKLDFKLEMRKVSSFLADYYSVNDQLYPVKFFGDYFKQPIEEIEIERLHSLLSCVPVYIIYTDIRSDAVTFRVASWKMQDKQAMSFSPIEWNWREVERELLKAGKTEDEILLIIRAVIIKIYQILLAFYIDIYYLNLDPYYEVRLPNIDLKKELIQPYSDLLKAKQKKVREAYEQQLARRFEEEKEREENKRGVEEEDCSQEEEKGKEFSFEIITVDPRGNIIKPRLGKGFQKSENLGNNIDLEIVYIPGGTFLMGSPDGEGHNYEKPQHRVTVPSFYMGKYPITQEQWRIIASQAKIDIDLSLDPSYFKGNNRPVECVNWYQAVEFCKRLSKLTQKDYHLPSEAQWEYACRAGTTTPFAFGATLSTEIANYHGNYTYADGKKGTYRQQTTPVGQFPPNAFGLYDMHGQVWEWCADDWHDNYTGAPEDGSAWITENNNRSLLRGGSWYGNPGLCRSAFRSFFARRVSTYHYYGFRVVCGC